MTRRLRWMTVALSATAATAAVAVVAWCVLTSDRQAVDLDRAAPLGRLPHIDPDYVGVTVPPNVAPLNFVVVEEGSALAVRFDAGDGEGFTVRSRDGGVVIPAGPWRRLLEARRGGAIEVLVGLRTPGGAWHRFRRFAIHVAPEPMDRYLVYRLIRPIYNKYSRIRICQRDLAGYGERILLKNSALGDGCVNCHTFCCNDPSRMLLQIRSPFGAAMILARDGRPVKIDTRTRLSRSPGAYSSWHPSGRLVAFSLNRLSQLFHTVGENREVFDAHSDLGVYRVEDATVTTTEAIAQPDRNETWPAWSADGRWLYFSAAPKLPQERFREVRYDLMRIGYDPRTGAWGRLETLLAAADADASLLEPRPSPDGRWLLYTACTYGNFPIYQPSADLHLMDLRDRTAHRLACNSPRCDSYHGWSTNGRWIVFSSKRRTGVFARPYFAYIDAAGRSRKPFLLPQRDPRFYDAYIQTYNAPEFATGPVPVPRRAFGRVIRSPAPHEAVQATLDPAVPPRVEPAEPREAKPWHKASPRKDMPWKPSRAGDDPWKASGAAGG